MRRLATALVAVAAVTLHGCLATPSFTVTPVVTGLDHVWDIGFTPDGTMLFTERPGRISALVSGQRRVLAAPSDVVRASEAGLMGLAIDPEFASNRLIYVCLASTLGGASNDVRVARFRVATNYTVLTDRRDIVTGIPVNTTGELGRHSGCRPRFGPDGALWIGTGDAAVGSVPQDVRSLGGKILRVTRLGAGAAGNPGGSWDPRIWSIGHRNVQGLAWRASDGLGISTEHGPERDDEINRLDSGQFGWDPVRPPSTAYDERVPMTDRSRFPDARRALVTTQNQTIAMCGATFVVRRAVGHVGRRAPGGHPQGPFADGCRGRGVDRPPAGPGHRADGLRAAALGDAGARRGRLRGHEQRRRHRPHPAAHTRLKRNRSSAATALNPSRHVIFLPSSYVRP